MGRHRLADKWLYKVLLYVFFLPAVTSFHSFSSFCPSFSMLFGVKKHERFVINGW
jgi:hypothetical protein